MKLKITLLSVLLTAYAMTTAAQTNDNTIYEGVPFEMPRVARPSFPDYKVDIRDFGAVSDGQTICTEAINNAIAHVNAQGGGTVVIPAGLWISGPIGLLSNVNLYTEHGALVVFTTDLDAYEIVETSFEGLDTRRCQSPLYARNGGVNRGIHVAGQLAHAVEHSVVLDGHLGAEAAALRAEGHEGLALRLEKPVDLADLLFGVGAQLLGGVHLLFRKRELHWFQLLPAYMGIAIFILPYPTHKKKSIL